MDKATLERLDDDDWEILQRKPFLFSTETLLEFGKCCGKKCRHCPFFPTGKKGATKINITQN